MSTPESQPAAPRPSRLAVFAPLRPYWRAETGIFLGLWLYFLVVGRDRLFLDPGTFWHTVVGERILSSGQLIYTDPFTFTWHDRPWIAHQWLGECLMALAHRLDGFDTLLLATATLLAALYTWVATRLIRAGLHWTLTTFLVLLVGGAGAGHFHIRPHLATIVGLGVTMGFLVDFEAERIGWRRLWLLVPVYLIWTNIHGGTLGGLATFALALAGWTAYRVVRTTHVPLLVFLWRPIGWNADELTGPETPIRDLRTFVGCCAVLAACIATIFVNPYGALLPQTWLGIMESPTLRRIIVEHRQLRLSQEDAWLVLLLAGMYTLLLLSTLPRWPRISWLLPFVWLVQAFLRARHAPLFAITAALALADLLPYSRLAQRIAHSGSDLFQPPKEPVAPPVRDWRPAALPLVLIGAALVLQLARVPLPVLGHGWARLKPGYWPVELVDELRRRQDDWPGGTPIFNEYTYGAFLIYHAPGYRVFVDDRCELFRDPADDYPDQWLDQFVQAEGNDTAAAMRRWEQRYGRFPFALVQTRTGDARGFDNYFRSLPQEWEVVQRTPTATLYRRKE